jgi:predicted nucleic acid-binding protein
MKYLLDTNAWIEVLNMKTSRERQRPEFPGRQLSRLVFHRHPLADARGAS